MVTRRCSTSGWLLTGPFCFYYFRTALITSVSGCRYMQVSTVSTEAKKGHCVLGGRGTGGCEPPMWMLRNELRTSAGADSALEDRPILQQPLCRKHTCIGLVTGTVLSHSADVFPSPTSYPLVPSVPSLAVSPKPQGWGRK